MDDNQKKRIQQIHINLQNEFLQQQKPIEPVLRSLQNSVQHAKAHAFRLYRQKCKESFEELEKHTTISKNGDLALKKDNEDLKNIKTKIEKVMKCIDDQNHEFAMAAKKLIGEKKRFSFIYIKCNEDCLKEMQKKTDKQISDCYLNCNKDVLDAYGPVSKDLLKDYTKLVSGLEKL